MGWPMARRPAHQGVTDDAGSFAFADVAPGPVVLSAEALRHQRQELKGLEVKPGQDLSGVEIVLPAAAAVEGKVLLPDGRPAEGAEVTVAEPASHGAFFVLSPRASADDTGHYRLEGIAPGPHTLEAQLDGYRRAVRDVDLKEEARGVDFQLDRGKGEVSGRVIDEAGNPLEEASVAVVVSTPAVRVSSNQRTQADVAVRDLPAQGDQCLPTRSGRRPPRQ